MYETQSIDLAVRDRRPHRLTRLWRASRGPAISGATILAVIIAWQGAVEIFRIPDFILPAPTEVVVDTAGLGPAIFGHIEATLVTILAGYALAIVISLPLSIAISSSRLLSQMLYPLLVIKQSVPVVALAPILIVILGAGEAPRVSITMLIALFPLIVSTSTGLSATPPELIELSQSMGASWRKQLFDIRLPSAVPFIFSGLKVSMTLSVVGAVVAEFVAAERGLGYLIYTSTAYFHLSIAFGAMIILSFLGLVLFQSVVLIERFFFPWSVGSDHGVA
jgi:NitT/TauT family transport system permease protein